jgi:UDP-2,3-diacylglucosamine pyrophosphatase LpxH
MIKLPEFLAGTEEEEQLLDFKIKAETTKKQGQQQLVAVNRISTVEGFKLNLLEAFKDAIIQNSDKILGENKGVPKKALKKSENTLIIADLHFKGTEQCLETLLNIEKEIKLEKPNKIYLMGDIVNGQIRVGDKFAEKYPLLQETMLFIKHFTELLKRAKFGGKIFYVYGNHGEIRLFGGQRQEQTDNIEYVIAEALSQNWEVEHGIEVIDNDILLRHGHLHNKSFITWDLPENIKWVIRGHYHELEQFTHRDIEYMTVPTCMSETREYEKVIGKHPNKRVVFKRGENLFIKKV